MVPVPLWAIQVCRIKRHHHAIPLLDRRHCSSDLDDFGGTVTDGDDVGRYGERVGPVGDGEVPEVEGEGFDPDENFEAGRRGDGFGVGFDRLEGGAVFKAVDGLFGGHVEGGCGV